ncbi:MAG: glycogen/starch/alpha-glucan phosphorylase [Betaproteobacteria bacterium]
MSANFENTGGHHVKRAVDTDSIRNALAERLTYAVGKDHATATDRDWYVASSYVVRDHLIDRWMETMRSYYNQDVKRVYYFSLEFLMGRSLMNALHNLDLDQPTRAALQELGVSLEDLRETEFDAALGNGGLGRLAACFLDSMATLDLPGYGYGIRYEYGMFQQRIEDGRQVEHPDNWLRYGHPWEFARPEVLFRVKFQGQVTQYADDEGEMHYQWVDTDDVMAMAHDTPVPGYGTRTVNNMRLWAAKSSRDFDLGYFNQGNYIKAVEDKNRSENLSKVLYPNDSTEMGQELRLKQQYFFTCASLQDILYRYLKGQKDFDAFPDKVAIQLNDTHPAISIPELMRVLVDVHYLPWDKAWDISVRTFSYTNHTLMPEALETWPVEMFGSILPRHMQIIDEINHRFLEKVRHQFAGDTELLRRLSIISEHGGKRIRMAHLAAVGSHRVNGVAALHTELMRKTIFCDFARVFPGRIVNMTNGITPRRWLNQANPALTELISLHIGKEWIKDLGQLKRLIPLADDALFCQRFAAIKQANKLRLAVLIKEKTQIEVNPDSLFDVQIKRIHEYKRQLLNLLHVVTLYNRIRRGQTCVPRTVIFGGKAAPGYAVAKLIIKLINDVADIVNNDPCAQGLLKLVFIPNYDVSTAEFIVPAADLSEQISTAGTEASGTGNMKLALNGALTIGTLDGANVEIADEVGRDNIFIFGLTVDQVATLQAQGYRPRDYCDANAELRDVLHMIGSGFFSPDEPDRFQAILDKLLVHGDQYLLLADYAAYIDCQGQVEAAYLDQAAWVKKAVLNVANMGQFSSDRSIAQYASEIWDVKSAKKGA